MSLQDDLRACTICADRFSATETRHTPRPVVWFRSGARILIASQAPGARAHTSSRPFTDPSGDRLRAWMDVTETTFYDQEKIAIVPMAFCFPGYDAKGSDRPPPKICASTWRAPVLEHVGDVPLVLLIGGYAQSWHLGTKTKVTETVAAWRDHAPHAFPLPHPSWRNTGWIRNNPWFEADVLPALRARVKEVLQ